MSAGIRRRSAHVPARWLAACCGVALSCAAPLPPPYPRVLSASPAGVVAPDDVAVEIVFSAPVEPEGLVAGRLLTLCRREDLRTVVQALESDGGAGAGTPRVAARVSLAAGDTRATLRPEAPLAPEQAWAAVLSPRLRAADGRPVLDPEGRARTFAVLFDTGPAADRAAPRPRWVHPPHGPAPANVQKLLVGFDEPVSGALALGSPGAPSQPLPPADGVLGLELGGPLPPGALAVDLGAVRDAAGNAPAPLEALAVSACMAQSAPAVSGVRAEAGELSVAVVATLSGMGALLAEISSLPGEPACGEAPAYPAAALITGPVRACPGWDPCAPTAAACPGAVELTGLCPGRAIRLRLLAEDLAGHRAAEGAWREVAASPPRPLPVLSEVLADADAPEEAGEYVEVANLGTGELDLAGFVLAKHTASGKVVRCTVAPGASVPPGGHALIVGGAYDGRYGVPGTAVHRCGAGALLGGLPNDRPVAIGLEDRDGAVRSTAGVAEPAPRCPAGAVERVHPAGPDAAANWACPAARTPGACNQSTPPAECPGRRW